MLLYVPCPLVNMYTYRKDVTPCIYGLLTPDSPESLLALGFQAFHVPIQSSDTATACDTGAGFPRVE